jgi:hypothetical protein
MRLLLVSLQDFVHGSAQCSLGNTSVFCPGSLSPAGQDYDLFTFVSVPKHL